MPKCLELPRRGFVPDWTWAGTGACPVQKLLEKSNDPLTNYASNK